MDDLDSTTTAAQQPITTAGPGADIVLSAAEVEAIQAAAGTDRPRFQSVVTPDHPPRCRCSGQLKRKEAPMPIHPDMKTRYPKKWQLESQASDLNERVQ